MKMALVAGLIGLVMAGCSKDETATGGDAPDYRANALDGAVVSLASLKGKPVLLDFWATWCGPCKVSLPVIDRFHRDYAAKGLVVMAVSTDDAPAQIRQFLKANQLSLPAYTDAFGLAATRLDVSGLPTTILVNREGKIVYRETGVSEESLALLEAEVKKVL